MSYEFHLARRGGGRISEAEWRAALEATPGVRISGGAPMVGTNPATGEEIRVKSNPLDGEFQFPRGREWGGMAGQWVPIFRFRERTGRVSFEAAFDPEDPRDPVRKAVSELAKRLGAEMVGDEGETYPI